VSRRFSVTAGFCRTCVIDGLLERSPAEHVRRPSVPLESPTLGFTHLQFEALLTAARAGYRPRNRHRICRPILLNSRRARMDRHAATRRLRGLAQAAGVPITRPHPHMLRHTFVTTMLDAEVDTAE